MGGRRRSSQAAASGAEDGCDGAAVEDLTSRVLRWKSEHPARDYVGRPLRIFSTASAALSWDVTGGVYPRMRGGKFLGDVVLIPMSARVPPL
eukprot:409004-Pyramimonas_sp.AAC.1